MVWVGDENENQVMVVVVVIMVIIRNIKGCMILVSESRGWMREVGAGM